MSRKWRKGICDKCAFCVSQLPLKVDEPDRQLPAGWDTTGLCLAPVVKTGEGKARRLGPKTTKMRCKQFTWPQPNGNGQED